MYNGFHVIVMQSRMNRREDARREGSRDDFGRGNYSARWR